MKEEEQKQIQEKIKNLEDEKQELIEAEKKEEEKEKTEKEEKKKSKKKPKEKKKKEEASAKQEILQGIIQDKKQDKEQNKIEVNNLLEEISVILEPCINCGMCKSLCPVFKIICEESVSPRGKAILLNNKILDKVMYKCNLCKACEEKCPLKIKVCDAILKAREALVLEGEEIESNKEMMENIRKSGNPFGEKKTGTTDGKLYCC